MKNSLLLMGTILFVIFSSAGFGDESSYAGNFNDYINSSESPSGDLIDKSLNQTHATDDKTRENTDRRDDKPVLQGVPAKWKACAMDSDCTAGVVDCVSWEPLNKKYLMKLSRNLNSCSASIDPGFQPETVCVAKACRTTGKTTNVSWEEWLSEMGIK